MGDAGARIIFLFLIGMIVGNGLYMAFTSGRK